MTSTGTKREVEDPELEPAAQDEDLVEVRGDPEQAHIKFFYKAMGVVTLPKLAAFLLSIYARGNSNFFLFLSSFTVMLVAWAATIACYSAFMYSKKVRSEVPGKYLVLVLLMVSESLALGNIASVFNHVQVILIVSTASLMAFFMTAFLTKSNGGGQTEFKATWEKVKFIAFVVIPILVFMCFIWMIMFHVNTGNPSLWAD